MIDIHADSDDPNASFKSVAQVEAAEAMNIFIGHDDGT
eukprot:gene16853-21492_t